MGVHGSQWPATTGARPAVAHPQTQTRRPQQPRQCWPFFALSWKPSTIGLERFKRDRMGALAEAATSSGSCMTFRQYGDIACRSADCPRLPLEKGVGADVLKSSPTFWTSSFLVSLQILWASSGQGSAGAQLVLSYSVTPLLLPPCSSCRFNQAYLTARQYPRPGVRYTYVVTYTRVVVGGTCNKDKA